ncbi:restriction endonuclease subunit S [Acinetobacter schindleri]|uniref:restriction endonuclease subunit S n=1 Tax=Acinetobacter schindleri TaxID=108981 RepID=UPI002DC02A3C|nr:restriction endonuclease subunit S [Acinetobacter schindleri]MEB5928329.1 restriction endonuclease subunit S [Acinetobacter schindleri]
MAVPKLRFKEFDGDWTKSSLINLAKDKSLNNGVFNDQNKVGQGYKLINVLDMYIERDIDESRLSLLDLDLKEFERNKVKFGDIFFTRSSLVKEGIAFSNVYLGHSQDITYDGHLIKLSPDLEVTNPSFLNYVLKTSKVRKQLIQGGKTATMTTIGQQEVGKTTIDFPVLDEQTKIASFLSNVDEKISQLTQKHELLSQYKQGMMQKLFSQQIRFKVDDGSEFGEWEEVRLGNLVDLTSGFAFKSDFFSEDGNKLITPKNFTTTGKANFTDTNTKWTTEISDKKYICRPNDLLVLLTDLTQSCELLGKPILLSQDDGNVLLNQRIVKIIPNRKLEKPFLLYLLLTDDFHELIVSTASGTTVKHSSNKVLQSFHFYLPCLEEQTKIANFLSAIDQKIEVVAHQIEQAKTWKKGLLQQMFV